MHRKSFLFGFGVSMIVISAIYYVVYQIDVRRLVMNYSEIAATEQLTDDEIRERAKKLGMLAVSDLPEHNETAQLTDEEIIQKAEDLGMAFIMNSEETDALLPYEAPDDPLMQNETTDPETSGTDEEDTSNVVGITIPPGSFSKKVSQILYDAGLVSNVDDFVRYTGEKKLTRRIRSGKYTIPKNATADEILDMITY